MEKQKRYTKLGGNVSLGIKYEGARVKGACSKICLELEGVIHGIA